VGCGTGESFPSLIAGTGEGGRLIGADASAEMLKKAQARSRIMGWENAKRLEVEVGDVGRRRVTREELGPIDRVLCFLSLSVIDAYEEVLDECFNALAPDTW
jgi:ubiquinone/menaquinone biosynthesis C-methylase UbiE